MKRELLYQIGKANISVHPDSYIDFFRNIASDEHLQHSIEKFQNQSEIHRQPNAALHKESKYVINFKI